MASSQLPSYPPIADFTTSNSNSRLQFYHRRNGSSSQYMTDSQPAQSLYGNSESHNPQQHPPNTQPQQQHAADPSQTIRFTNLTVSIAAIPSYIPAILHSLYLQYNLPSRTTLLNNVSGSVSTGKLIAIMGASGAGKSTLLHLLSNRMHTSGNAHVAGTITVNNKAVTQDYYTTNVGFVPQQSVLLSTLTVRETLQFITQLRLGHLTIEEVEPYVNSILTALSLHKCADTRVGDDIIGSFLSGGERRRLNIGVEMVGMPQLLMADEPTTGLDSATSYSVVKALKKLTQSTATAQPPTIICSIHQPSSDVFNLFDELILLAKGSVVYCGPVSEVQQYLSDHFNYQLPAMESLPDYLMDLLSVQYETEDSDMQRVKQMMHVYKVTHRHKVLHELPASISVRDSTNSQSALSAYHQIASRLQPLVPANASARSRAIKLQIDRPMQYKQPTWWYQFRILLQRSYLTVNRMPLLRAAQIGCTVFMGMFIGLVFLQLDHDQVSIQNWLGVVYFSLIGVILSASMGSVLVFVEERDVLLREQTTSLYNSTAYFAARTLVDLPSDIICMLGFSILTYFLVGFPGDAAKFCQYFVIMFLSSFAAKAMGLTIGACIKDRTTGMTISPLTIAPFILFTNYALPTGVMPSYFTPLLWLSPFHWSFSALAYLTFSGATFYCKEGQYIQLPSADPSVPRYFCYMTTGEIVMQRFTIADDSSSFGQAVGALLLLGIGFRVVAMIILEYVSASSRGNTIVKK